MAKIEVPFADVEHFFSEPNAQELLNKIVGDKTAHFVADANRKIYCIQVSGDDATGQPMRVIHDFRLRDYVAPSCTEDAYRLAAQESRVTASVSSGFAMSQHMKDAVIDKEFEGMATDEKYQAESAKLNPPPKQSDWQFIAKQLETLAPEYGTVMSEWELPDGSEIWVVLDEDGIQYQRWAKKGDYACAEYLTIDITALVAERDELQSALINAQKELSKEIECRAGNQDSVRAQIRRAETAEQERDALRSTGNKPHGWKG